MNNDFIKIINETYKLLDFFPDSEPLKNKAKEKALAILENLTLISEAGGWSSLKKERVAAELLDNIGVLENYLELGRYQGFIDNMSFLIITREYNKIKNSIDVPRDLMRENLRIISELKKPAIIENAGQDKEVVKQPEKTVSISEKADPQITKNLSERQTKILDILSKKSRAQVSDMIKEIPEVTKRTIRRDLDDLLKKSKIIRAGEWNQVFYRINSVD